MVLEHLVYQYEAELSVCPLGLSDTVFFFCDFSEWFPDFGGKNVQDYLFIFLVWRAGTKLCLMKFSETGVMRMLDFVSSEK